MKVKVCCVPGCGQPRHISKTGKVLLRCQLHEQERNAELNYRKRGGVPKKSKAGRPSMFTHVLDLGDGEQVRLMPARTERQKKMQAVLEKLAIRLGWEFKEVS